MAALRVLLRFLLLLSVLHYSHGSSSNELSAAVTTSTVVARTATADESGNPIGQFAGYIKDSVVRTAEGFGTLYKNHQRCNSIRAKQKDHKDKIQKKLEMEGRLSKDEIKKRLKTVNGGITYEEYVFLIKGKEDRGKLMNMAFITWSAPKFLPYMLMFYPSMLPSPLARTADASGRESGLEKLSRERSHAVIQTLLNIENDAKVVPSFSKLNIFGKKAQEERMDAMGMMGALTSKILSTPCVRGPFGAQLFMNALGHHFYSDQEYSRADNRLIGVPKSLIRGMVTLVEGPSPLTSFFPNFMNRGKVITHIKKITDCDEFLVNEKIDLETLESVHLVEACSERMIGGPGWSDEELRECLSEWLKLSVVQPAAKLQQGEQYYNSNLATFSLLCYNALDATRDDRSASYLPRTLFQGQIKDTQDLIEDTASTDKNKKNKN
jgi:LETM1-like protein